jgi:hypothetical protein
MELFGKAPTIKQTILAQHHETRATKSCFLPNKYDKSKTTHESMVQYLIA